MFGVDLKIEFFGNEKIIASKYEGVQHQKHKMPCQDAFAYGRINNIFWVAVADGVGSSDYSHIASQTAVSCLHEFNFPTNFDNGKEHITSIFDFCRNSVFKKAEDLKLNKGDMETTLQVLAYDNEKVLYGRIGDGGAVYLNSQDYVSLGLVDKSSLGTNTLSSDTWQQHMTSEELPLHETKALFLFTDGLEGYFLGEKIEERHSVNRDYVTKISHLLNENNYQKNVDVINKLLGAENIVELSDDKTLVCISFQESEKFDPFFENKEPYTLEEHTQETQPSIDVTPSPFEVKDNKKLDASIELDEKSFKKKFLIQNIINLIILTLIIMIVWNEFDPIIQKYGMQFVDLIKATEIQMEAESSLPRP